MFEKIFGGNEGKLKEHSELLVRQNELIRGLSEQMAGVTSELVKFKQEHLILQQVFDKNLDMVKSLKGEFAQEIEDFKMLKNRLHETVGSRVISGLDDKLSGHLDRLKTDVSHFNTLKASLSAVGGSLDELRSEVSRLKSVTGAIKAADFEMTRFANKITTEDKNKLELMQRVDTLQKLIAHERRNRH